jgi:isohexenylglutaconyl-CoA hydratase
MIRIETRGAFVFATLDVPATRNALTDAMVAGLADALRLADSLPEARALVIRGAGGTFCAGGDFSGFRASMATPAPADGADPIATGNRRFGALLEQWCAAPVATIAVVEGGAIGGGCGLAAACDIVLAAASAKFATPEVTLGLPPAQIAPFVADRIGTRAALRLLLTGRRLDAAQALAFGLADEVLADAALDARLHELLAELGRAEPAALRATKAILRHPGLRAETLDFASRAFAAALRSGRASEGLAALAARRPAAWTTAPGGPAP